MNSPDELLQTHLRVRPQSHTASVLRMLLRTGMELIKADESSLLVVDKEADCLRFAMTVGSDRSERALFGQAVPFGSGWTGRAASTREVQVGAPIYKDIRQIERAEGSGNDPEAVIAAPMVLDDQLVGVITAVSFEKGRRFDSQVARQFGAFAVIGAVLVNQEQRLARLESSQGLMETLADPAAQEIKEIVTRIAATRPASLPNIASLLGDMERMLTVGA
jgi:transcriptional regulator with GAF, ATPase, and Fis domain